MSAMRADEIYHAYVKQLSSTERLRLLALLAEDVADSTATTPKRNIMDLHGLGKELWQQVDAREYVDRLRDEWER